MSTDGGYRSYAGDDLVTGEGVAVELPVAGVASRAVSGLVDLVVAAVAMVAGGFLVLLTLGGASEATARTAMVLLVVAVTVGVPTVLETLTRGRTVGKLLLGLRVVRDDGGPVTARHALTRALVGWVEVYLLLGAGALVASLVSPQAKRLGDMAAGTYVVAQRRSMRLLTPPQLPPALATWAGSADLAGLPPGLAIAVRQFLGRAPSLTPASRQQLGQDLLRSVLPHVSPPPPAGTPPEVVLAAVIADRRRRDADRLRREDALRARVLPPDPLLP
jgi:uncharacterized RDD family membrane protein YckC